MAGSALAGSVVFAASGEAGACTSSPLIRRGGDRDCDRLRASAPVGRMRILCRHRGRTDGGCRRPILLRIHRRQSTELEPGLLGLHAEALDLAEMVEEQAPQRHGNDHGNDRQPGRRPAAVLDDQHRLRRPRVRRGLPRDGRLPASSRVPGSSESPRLIQLVVSRGPPSDRPTPMILARNAEQSRRLRLGSRVLRLFYQYRRVPARPDSTAGLPVPQRPAWSAQSGHPFAPSAAGDRHSPEVHALTEHLSICPPGPPTDSGTAWKPANPKEKRRQDICKAGVDVWRPGNGS